MTILKNTYIKWLAIGGIIVFLTILGIEQAYAASLFFAPRSNTYQVGKTFSVGVYVNSKDKAINAASGELTFPTEKLEVVSISKEGSIINLWMREPSFSNENGTVSFEGVAFYPGYIGSKGKLIAIQFRTKSAGDAPVNIASGSLLANDGEGTEILSKNGGAKFIIEAAAAEKPLPAPAKKAKTKTAPSPPSVLKEIPKSALTPQKNLQAIPPIVSAATGTVTPVAETFVPILYVGQFAVSYPAITITLAVFLIIFIILYISTLYKLIYNKPSRLRRFFSRFRK